MVSDYRRLNAQSVIDKYSIRTIDQCIEEIGKNRSRIFSCLDLTSGFWQLQLAKESRPYTAFTIPGLGQFQWKVMAQGLMGAPASFSRLMDLILRDCDNTITYIDDVLAHTKDHGAHIRALAEVIDRIAGAGLRLSPSKCTFGANQVPYLGFQLTSAGIRPGPDKTAAIRDTPLPSTTKQVRSFVGMVNFFRHHVKNFARIAAPLYALTRRDSAWKKGDLPPEAARAVEALKRAITSSPVLQYPNPSGRFHLYIDAAQGTRKTRVALEHALCRTRKTGTSTQSRTHPADW